MFVFFLIFGPRNRVKWSNLTMFFGTGWLHGFFHVTTCHFLFFECIWHWKPLLKLWFRSLLCDSVAGWPRCWYLLKPPLKRKNSTATWCKTESINWMKGGQEKADDDLNEVSDLNFSINHDFVWNFQLLMSMMTIKTPWWKPKAMVEGIASVLCVDALEGLSCRGIYRRRPDLQVAKWGWKRERKQKRDMKWYEATNHRLDVE